MLTEDGDQVALGFPMALLKIDYKSRTAYRLTLCSAQTRS